MKLRQVVFGLVGVIGLILAFEVGRHFVPPPASNNRLITISASPSSDIGKCEVDFPVALVRSGAHSVQWESNDKPYWISFKTIKQPPQDPYYQAENPLTNPSDDPVYVPAAGQGKSTMYKVKDKTKYYYYAIYDHDPKGDNSNPCKDAGDDKDTGLNVKP